MVEATSQYAEFKNLIVWNKHSAGLGTFYRSKHELIFVMKNGRARHINNFGLGEKGRYRSNVWDYPGLSGWTPVRKSELEMHPTVKPVALIADALKDCSRKGGIVLDCFAMAVREKDQTTWARSFRTDDTRTAEGSGDGVDDRLDHPGLRIDLVNAAVGVTVEMLVAVVIVVTIVVRQVVGIISSRQDLAHRQVLPGDERR